MFEESAADSAALMGRKDVGMSDQINVAYGLDSHDADRSSVFLIAADSGGSRPRIRDDVAHHSDLMSLGVPR
jgi:hypothetical protein